MQCMTHFPLDACSDSFHNGSLAAVWLIGLFESSGSKRRPNFRPKRLRQTGLSISASHCGHHLSYNSRALLLHLSAFTLHVSSIGPYSDSACTCVCDSVCTVLLQHSQVEIGRYKLTVCMSNRPPGSWKADIQSHSLNVNNANLSGLDMPSVMSRLIHASCKQMRARTFRTNRPPKAHT